MLGLSRLMLMLVYLMLGMVWFYWYVRLVISEFVRFFFLLKYMMLSRLKSGVLLIGLLVMLNWRILLLSGD